MLEVIEGLKAAGVKTKDIVVFERYRDEFIGAKMHEAVPDGVDWGGLGVGYNGHQLDIKGVDDLKTDDLDRVAGYDPDEFMVMELVGAGEDPKDDRTRRSHLGLLVTRRVNKIVLLPVLKDHGSAGVTGALKNMSHGLVNNVGRSHSTPDTNVCNQFIPQVVTHPIIRKKCVLHIMDGIRGVYQGGPSASRPEWTWENNALLFATDPVAMDHVEWRHIDAKRKEKGLPPVGASGKLGLDPLGKEGFDIRQPQHIRPGRQPRPGPLRLQLAPGPEVLDRPQENQPGVKGVDLVSRFRGLPGETQCAGDAGAQPGGILPAPDDISGLLSAGEPPLPAGRGGSWARRFISRHGNLAGRERDRSGRGGHQPERWRAALGGSGVFAGPPERGRAGVR